MIGYIGYIENGVLVRQERVDSFDLSSDSAWYALPALDVWNCTVNPSPYNSWVLNKWRGKWEAPVPMPQGGDYNWDEPTQSWVAA